jgi:hypothetical protein
MTNLVFNMRRFIILERMAEVGKRGVIDDIACDCTGLVYRIELLDGHGARQGIENHRLAPGRVFEIAISGLMSAIQHRYQQMYQQSTWLA